MLRNGNGVGSHAAGNVFQEAADSLWSSHLEVEVAGLRAGTAIDSGSEPGQADALASCQWALQSCRCLVKLVSSKLSVRLTDAQADSGPACLYQRSTAVEMLPSKNRVYRRCQAALSLS